MLVKLTDTDISDQIVIKFKFSNQFETLKFHDWQWNSIQVEWPPMYLNLVSIFLLWLEPWKDFAYYSHQCPLHLFFFPFSFSLRYNGARWLYVMLYSKMKIQLSYLYSWCLHLCWLMMISRAKIHASSSVEFSVKLTIHVA